MLLSSFGTFSKVIRGFLVTTLPPSPKLVSLGSKCEYNAGQIFYGYSVDTTMKIFVGILKFESEVCLKCLMDYSV